MVQGRRTAQLRMVSNDCQDYPRSPSNSQYAPPTHLSDPPVPYLLDSFRFAHTFTTTTLQEGAQGGALRTCHLRHVARFDWSDSTKWTGVIRFLEATRHLSRNNGGSIPTTSQSLCQSYLSGLDLKTLRGNPIESPKVRGFEQNVRSRAGIPMEPGFVQEHNKETNIFPTSSPKHVKKRSETS